MIKILLLNWFAKSGIEKLHVLKKYEKVIESEIKNIYENYTKDIRAKTMNNNFAKTESYCMMNKFTPENVGELLYKIKKTETHSELVRCLRYTDKMFMFG